MNDFDRELMRKLEQKDPLDQFRDSMSKISENERLAGNAHFDEAFNPDELNEEDRELYERFKNPKDDNKTNAQELKSRMMDIDRKLNNSQKQLLAYMANKMQERIF